MPHTFREASRYADCQTPERKLAEAIKEAQQAGEHRAGRLLTLTKMGA
jgi:hypothetical protein